MDTKDWKSPLIGAGLGLGLGAGIVLARRRGLRKQVFNQLKNIGKNTRDIAAKEAIPAEVRTQAKQIANQLRRSGIDPSKAKIGIIATPGTGKSTMARALSEELGVKSLNLDGVSRRLIKGDTAQKYLQAQHGGKMPKGAILEQTYMPHTSDLDMFDVVVKLERPEGEIIKSLHKRGRGAFQADYVDYKKLQGEIGEAFNSLNARTIDLGGRAKIKVRGNSGFGFKSGLMQRARAKGLDLNAFAKLTQPQQLASLEAGKITKSYGATNTWRKGRLLMDTATVGGFAGLGAYYNPMNKKASIEYRGHTFPGYNKPIRNSGSSQHKMMVLAKKGDKVKLVRFGHRAYGHNYSSEAKQNYLKRSAGIRGKDGQLTKDDKFSANYWARRVLWPQNRKADGKSSLHRRR